MTLTRAKGWHNWSVMGDAGVVGWYEEWGVADVGCDESERPVRWTSSVVQMHYSNSHSTAWPNGTGGLVVDKYKRAWLCCANVHYINKYYYTIVNWYPSLYSTLWVTGPWPMWLFPKCASVRSSWIHDPGLPLDQENSSQGLVIQHLINSTSAPAEIVVFYFSLTGLKKQSVTVAGGHLRECIYF